MAKSCSGDVYCLHIDDIGSDDDDDEDDEDDDDDYISHDGDDDGEMEEWRNGGGVATKNGDTCGKPCSQQKLRQTMYKLSRFCLFLVVHCKWNLDFRRAHCLQRS